MRWSAIDTAHGGALSGDHFALVGERLQVGVLGGRVRRTKLSVRAVVARGDRFVAASADCTYLISRTGRVLARRAGGGALAIAGGALWQAGDAGLVRLDDDGAPRGVPAPLDGALLGGAAHELLVGGSAGLVALDPRSGACRELLGERVHAAAGAPDGRWVAVGERAWLGGSGSAPTGLAERGLPAVGDGFFTVGAVLLAPDGTPVRTFGNRGSFLSDGPRLVFVGDGWISEIDPGWRPEPRGPRGDVGALAAAGPWCVAADGSGHATVWDRSGRVLRVLPMGRSIDAPPVAITGDTLWVGHGAVQRWDLRTGQRTAVIDRPWIRSVHSLEATADGGVVVGGYEHAGRLGPDGAERWVLGPWRRSDYPADARVRHAIVSDDGETVAVALDSLPCIVGSPPHGSFVEGPRAEQLVPLSGGRFAAGARHDAAVVDRSGVGAALPVFSRGCATEQGPLLVENDTVTLLGPDGPRWSTRFTEEWRAFASSGDRLYTATRQAGVAERKLEDGARQGLLASDVGDKIVSVALDGRWLLVGEWNRVHLWDLAPAVPAWRATLDLRASRPTEPIGLPEEGMGQVQQVALGRGGVQVACGAGLSWGSPEAFAVAPPDVLRAETCLSGVSSDGRRWLSGGDEVQVYASDGTRLYAAPVDYARDHDERLSADGERLLVRRDGDLTVHDVERGAPIATLACSRTVEAAVFDDAGAVVGFAGDRPVPFRWDPTRDDVQSPFRWPRTTAMVHDLACTGPWTLLWGAHGGAVIRLGGGEVRAYPPVENGTAMALGADGTVVLARWSGHTTVYAPDGTPRAELLVALDGRWRVRVDCRIVGEAP